MQKTPVSFAAVFTRNGGAEPICSICFFADPDSSNGAVAVTDYLIQTVIPQLAPIIPNSDPETVSSAIQNCMDEMEQGLGVHCQGFLTDYNLSICAKT